MKIKLLQIILGAVGSMLTVLVSHLANLPPDVTLGATLGAGPLFSVALSGAVNAT